MSSVVTLENVSRRYCASNAQPPALNRINLQLQPGEMRAISGPSGSGKSTLLNICGLLDCGHQGSSHFLAQPLQALTEQALTQLRRLHIGFVFQKYNLIPTLTAFENIEYSLVLKGVPNAERRRAVTQIAGRVEIAEHLNRRPEQLSGGQQQRVAIARALIKRPALVIADEPTANLDSRTAAAIIALMASFNREFNTTFLIATHDPAMAAQCSQQTRLIDGELQ